MTTDVLKAAIQKSLKHTVMLNLTSGKNIRVIHPDFTSLHPDAQEFFLWVEGGGFDVVSLDEIASVTVTPRHTVPGKAKP